MANGNPYDVGYAPNQVSGEILQGLINSPSKNAAGLGALTQGLMPGINSVVSQYQQAQQQKKQQAQQAEMIGQILQALRQQQAGGVPPQTPSPVGIGGGLPMSLPTPTAGVGGVNSLNGSDPLGLLG